MWQMRVPKSKPQRIREMQLQHLKLLKLIDVSSLGLPSRKRLLPPLESLYCIQLDPANAQMWDELQIDEFEKRCQWERNVRSDFIYGASPRKDTFKYHNPYARFAVLVSRIVRSPQVENKARESHIVISPIATKLSSPQRTPSPNKQAETPLSTIEETPNDIKWFQLPGKKKILEIKQGSKKYSSPTVTPSPPSPITYKPPVTPPTQILLDTDSGLRQPKSEDDGLALDKRFHEAWSKGQFTTPNSDRTVHWGSHDASAVLKGSSAGSSSSNDSNGATNED